MRLPYFFSLIIPYIQKIVMGLKSLNVYHFQ